MTILDFDEPRLVRELESLPPRLRATFAAACAERIRPAYVEYSAFSGRGDSGVFEAILDELWTDLEKPSMTDEVIASKIEICMGLLPQDDDEPWFLGQEYAEDAGAALAYALGCRRNGDCQEGAWAARRAYEAFDCYVVNTDNMDRAVPGAHEQIISHPLIQTEFARQRRDLDELRAATVAPERAIIALRERAKREAASVFKVLS